MTNHKAMIKSCTALAMSAVLTLNCAWAGTGVALAAGKKQAEPVNKEETVYIVADADGTPTKEIVSAWLKNPEGKTELADKADLTDIELTKGNQSFTQDADGKLVWKADGSDIHYQGHSTKSLPVDTKITYKLDGKCMDAKDLSGASGHLTMIIQYQNQTAEKKLVKGKEVTMYQPFLAASTVMFDSAKASEVAVDHGKVIDTGDQIIVVGMGMPGLRESLGLEELGDKKGKEIDLGYNDQVVIEADVKDYAMMTTLTMFDNSALQELNLDNVDSVDDLKEDLDKLADAATQLEDGSVQLAEGTGALSEGAQKLVDGIQTLQQGAFDLEKGILSAKTGSGTLKSGIETAASGANTLSINLKELAEGAHGLYTSMPSYYKGMKQLKKGTITLKKGAHTYVDGVTEYVNSASDGVKQLAAGGKKLSSLEKLGQITTAVNSISDGLGSEKKEDTLVYGCAQVSAGLKLLSNKVTALQNSTDAENLAKLGQGLASIKSGITSANQVIAGASAQLEADSSALNKKIKAVNEKIDAVNDQTDAYNKGVQELENGKAELKSQRNQANAQISQANDQIADAIRVLKQAASETEDEETKAKLQDQIQALSGVHVDEISASELSLPGKKSELESLENYSIDQTTYAVSKETLDKIGTAIEAGAAQIPDSIDTSSITALSSAVNQLSTGAAANLEGAKKLATGVKTLKASTDKLPEAAKGMKQLNEGLSEMASDKGAFMLGGKKLKLAGPEIEEGIDSLKEGETTLISATVQMKEGAAALANGSGQLYNGSVTLDQGMIKLVAGAGSLATGMNQLSTGAGKLTAGTGTLAAGGSELKTGTTSLQEGADQLKDGMKEFNQEGIAKLTELVDQDLEGVVDRLKLLQDMSKEYTSFSGADEDTESSVRFILRTEAIGD